MTAQVLAEPTTAPSPQGGCEQPRDVLAYLLALSGHGDTAAFAEFYDRTCATAYHLGLALCADQQRAAELVQALYVSAWVRARHHAGSGLSPLAWLLADAVRSAARQAARGQAPMRTSAGRRSPRGGSR